MNHVDDFITVEDTKWPMAEVSVTAMDGETTEVIVTLPRDEAHALTDKIKALLVTWDSGFYLHKCVAGDHPATRHVFPYLDEDNGTYMVCDDDSHFDGDMRTVAEIERL